MENKNIVSSRLSFNPNLGGLFNGSFWGGRGGKITTSPV